MLINGRKYDLAPSSQHLRLKILNQTPNKVAKYFALNNHNIKGIENLTLFANTPNKFNDLFESAHQNLPFDKFPFEAFGGVIGDRYHEEMAIFKSEPQKFYVRMRTNIYSHFIQSTGLLSTSVNCHSDLMWAHYTNNEGFLLEFNVWAMPNNFTGPYPIQYIDDLSLMTRKHSDDLRLQIYSTFLLKKAIWEYENEYRYIIYPSKGSAFETDWPFDNSKSNINKEPRSVRYPIEAIARVILGMFFFVGESDDDSAFEVLEDGFIRTTFQSDLAPFKCRLLSKLIEMDVTIELIVLNLSTGQLMSSPLELRKVKDSVFEFRETNLNTNTIK